MLLLVPCRAPAQAAQTNQGFFLPKNATAAAYVLGRLSNQALTEAPRSEFVYAALLQRKGLERKYRIEALQGLAKTHGTDVLTELVSGLSALDKKGEASEATINELTPLLLQTPADQLKAKRAGLEQVAHDSQLPLTRQVAFAALVTADGGIDPAWTAAQGESPRLADLIRSLRLVRDGALRSNALPRLEPLLHQADPPELRQAAIFALPAIPGHEAQAFRTLAGLVQGGTESAAALASLERIPKNLWPKESVKPLLDALLAELQKAPPDQRSEPEYVNAVQFAKDLASLLPTEIAAAIAKTLRGLSSRVFLIRTIPEQMLYDQNLIVVEAGKPVELILQNDDAMPHNIVIAKPGAAEEIGNAAEKMPLTPDAQGRLYVPDLPSVLYATTMVESGHRAKIAFTAPETPGDYPYLCSFPGHWRRMLGNLAVVPDVEAYLASHVTTAPKITEWKIDDLSADLAAPTGRNLAHGHELFTKLTCASCHRLGAEGVNYGPDLGDVFKRYQNDRREVLRQILEPSLVISNRYRNVWFGLKDGEDATGMILSEDANRVTIQTGAAASLIQTLAKSDIQDRRPKDLSPMPVGLLSTATKDDILDLLAWLEAGAGGPEHSHQH